MARTGPGGRIMAAGKKRGAKPFGAVANPKAKKVSEKDAHRSAVHGRAAQGMGSGGRSGGTKSSGGKGRAKGGPTPSEHAAHRGAGGKPAGRR
ncbi:MAG: hypothetical protein U1E39_13000 [Planctomycetota bacterium]